MNIGDRVRMLRAKEQGVVSRFLPGNIVEIEIEDGFRIPVMRSELVVVSPLEAERLLKTDAYAPQKTTTPGNTTTGASTPGQILANQGIYLGFVSVNDREYSLHVVNNTDWEFPYTIGEESAAPTGGVQFRGLHSGVLKAKSQQKLNDHYTHATFENWPTFVVQGLWFRPGKSNLRPPFVKRFRARAASFFKEKVTVPILNQPGFLTQLDADNVEGNVQPVPTSNRAAQTRPQPIRPDELKAEMLKPKSDVSPISVERPSSVVDLHIEALLPGDLRQRTPADLLKVQLDTFEKALENAIASGMSDITFIHGVGSGALRQELHKRLGQHPNVRFFEDAQKQKFGYGATKVTIK